MSNSMSKPYVLCQSIAFKIRKCKLIFSLKNSMVVCCHNVFPNSVPDQSLESVIKHLTIYSTSPIYSLKTLSPF